MINPQETKINARLFLNGEPLPDDLSVDVFMCTLCDGKGRRQVVTGASLSSEGKHMLFSHEEQCVSCRGAGFVLYVKRGSMSDGKLDGQLHDSDGRADGGASTEQG
jgi:RecJ-like exonuclease